MAAVFLERFFASSKPVAEVPPVAADTGASTDSEAMKAKLPAKTIPEVVEVAPVAWPTMNDKLKASHISLKSVRSKSSGGETTSTKAGDESGKSSGAGSEAQSFSAAVIRAPAQPKAAKTKRSMTEDEQEVEEQFSAYEMRKELGDKHHVNQEIHKFEHVGKLIGQTDVDAWKKYHHQKHKVSDHQITVPNYEYKPEEADKAAKEQKSMEKQQKNSLYTPVQMVEIVEEPDNAAKFKTNLLSSKQTKIAQKGFHNVGAHHHAKKETDHHTNSVIRKEDVSKELNSIKTSSVDVGASDDM